MRRSGMLMPISALPSKYGIGSFGKEACQFIDILKASGQSLWQILPLGPTGYGDSPYQAFSTFAGNPYYIDLEELISQGLLTEEECEKVDFGQDPEFIEYEKLYRERFPILRKAYERAKKQNLIESKEYVTYVEQERYWLQDYALYMAIKNENEGNCWLEWEENLRLRKEEAMKEAIIRLADEVEFHEFQQYLFYTQWMKVKSYANENGIEIIGDIPIYVSLDSADTWAAPELFQLDETGYPEAVAGCPPDGFSVTGQLWGNPLYDWEYNQSTGYAWWMMRIKACFKWYDILRIDHFRGFDEYYAIPYGDATAVNGSWQTGPGMDLFRMVQKEFGDLPIIAEDLGFLTESVKELLEASGYPGMKVLQFAFDSRESGNYLPHNYEKNCVVYTGTHDNDTTRGWYQAIDENDKQMALDYLGNYYTPEEKIHWDYIGLAMRSVADTCIIPVQDYLGLGSEARMNIPSKLGGNWRWRMQKDVWDRELIDKVRRLTELCARSVNISE